jgi:hypothetical protein
MGEGDFESDAGELDCEHQSGALPCAVACKTFLQRAITAIANVVSGMMQGGIEVKDVNHVGRTVR